ncbi:MAG TPA: hypothetical protein VLK65_19410 [Vicinamibacteria bacterium]|nr:hypothetical protein [Vicinamibacteria bacterium]
MKTGRVGAIRVRTLIEVVFLFVLAYFVAQVTPAVVVRLKFLGDLNVAANAPVQDSTDTIRGRVIELAEGYGITLLSERVHVERNPTTKRTTIDVAYQLHINFWPNQIYVWNVRDRVEALTY